MKPGIRFILMMVFLLGVVSVVSAQEHAVYVFEGNELQRIENGGIVQSWYMPNSLETQQIMAALEARAHFGRAANEYRFEFDQERMYILHEGQVVGLWTLRGNRWVNEPVLNVQYRYMNGQVKRFVNGEVQNAWRLPYIDQENVTESYIAGMQALANEQIAVHMFTELYSENRIEHIPQLVGQAFKLHYIPQDQTADWSWYKPELANLITRAAAEPIAAPVILSTGDLVITQHPTEPTVDRLLNLPPLENVSDTQLFDIYRIHEGRIEDLWLGYDLSVLPTE